MKMENKLLNSILEVSHDEFQTFDLSHNKLIFSSGMANQILGYPREKYRELSDGFYRDIIHPEDIDMIEQTVKKVIHAKQGEVVEMTARFRKSDGNYISLYSRNMIFERNHEKKKVVIIRQVQDVTKIIDLELKLKERVKQLNIVSFQNSHLVRGPVANIIGLVDMIEDSEITSLHNHQILHHLKNAITKLDQVIHEINYNANPS